MNGKNFEAVVEEFRQYIIAHNVKHLEYVHNLVEEAQEKQKSFMEYVENQANWRNDVGYMREISYKIKRGNFGQSCVSKSYDGRPYDLFYGYSKYLQKTYPWYFNMTEKYRYGKKAVEGETLEEMFVRIATDDANNHIEKFFKKVEEKAGEIQGAKALYICNGDINGVVVGSNCDVKVTTFGAGGWNIQRFHFRTKVTALKQRA